MIKADLHLHTTYSDGDLTPREVVSAAASLGYTQVAVTDHDTIAGVKEALAAGREFGVSVVPGTEVTVRFVREYFVGSLHLLVYFPESLLSSSFVSDLNGVVSRGRGLSLVKTRVTRINEEFGPSGRTPLLSTPLTVSSVTALGSNITRRHFALVLSSLHGLSLRQVSSVIGNASPAYVPSGVDLSMLSPLFSAYPVVPVLAHPAAGSFPGEGHYKEVLPGFSTVARLLPEFLAAGLLGLEVYYPGHTSSHQDMLFSLAVSLGLLVTGGSDCHDTSTRPIGASGLCEPVDFSPFFSR